MVTQEELAYAHDLSTFVGRKLRSDKESNEDPSCFSWGTLPQKKIDQYNQYAAKLIDRNPVLLNALKESMQKSMQKYNKTKDAASQSGITAAREMTVKVHPQFEGEMNSGDQFLLEF